MKNSLISPTECDQTFVSRAGGPQNGTFSAPSILNPTNTSRQCLYIFLAGEYQISKVFLEEFIKKFSFFPRFFTIPMQVLANELTSHSKHSMSEELGQSKR